MDVMSCSPSAWLRPLGVCMARRAYAGVGQQAKLKAYWKLHGKDSIGSISRPRVPMLSLSSSQQCGTT